MSQNDTVHVEGSVEIDFGDEVSVIVRSTSGADVRAKVKKSAIRFHEVGPVRAGDRVSKGAGKTKKEGVVKHREGDFAWVTFGDSHSVEAVEGLTRV